MIYCDLLPNIMMAVRELEPPEIFPFPFEPYGIQRDFMRELYLTLERGKVGIFESPTGTGKSLSIICGALRWLLDREMKDKEEMDAVLEGRLSPSVLQGPSAPLRDNAGEDEPDWFAAYDKKKEERECLQRLKDEIKRREDRETRIKKLREEQRHLKWKTKRKRDVSPVPAEEVTSGGGGQGDDDDLVVGDYCSDEDEKGKEEYKSSDSEEDIEESNIRKIYYCSRTHTQLAQFVKEVQKSIYGDSIQLITLGSRQNLCINPEVTRLKSINAMNDICLEMQKSKKKSTTKNDKQRTREGQAKSKQQRKKSISAHCPFYKPGALESFRDMALAKVQDIEQLVSTGKDMSACPYYGTRRAVPAAQLVVLPYNTLLHAPTRDAVGITLKGNVVIIDEAHNLMDTISNVYSVQIKGTHVTKAHSQLSQYMDRYRSRLKAKNLMYINQILQVLKCFITLLQTGPQGAGMESKLVRLNDFLFTSNIDNINIFKILRYCTKSQISRKLNGFVDRYSESNCEVLSQQGTGGGGGEEGGDHRHMNSPLMLIEGFLQALTNTDTDGRIVINKRETVSASSLKFLLLNPSIHFTHVVKEASVVIVTGGTLQPVGEFKDQLLTQAGIGPNGIVEFTCGHVIPPDHLLPLVLCKGPSGENLEFSYQTRERNKTIDELGRMLVNLTSIVPGGVVCFFPSYEYENKVCSHWEKSGVLERISKKKKIFREPRLSSQVDPVLSQYGKHIERCVSRGHESEGTSGSDGQTGAILFSVVGGKLSEGINFSDDLGRCIVMVGLPYPNITSPELKEKMDYLNTTMPRHSDGRLPGQVHYENLCMKAVNQSIGRAIRHSNDYACIILADLRYERKNVAGQLPKWIASQLCVCKSFGQGFAATRKFFNSKKSCRTVTT